MKGYRVAVVSPLSPFGRRVRALLEQTDTELLPVIELKLFDARPNAGSTLTQFEDEVLVTQTLDPDLFPSLDAIFVGEDTSPEVLSQVSHAASQGVLTLVAGGQVEGPVVAGGLNDRFLSAEARLVCVPQGASILLGKVLEVLGGAFDVRQAQATVMLPVSELGERAVSELHQQVVQLLNFGSPPTDVIGDHLAFNLLGPAEQSQTGAEGRARAGVRVGNEVEALAGLEENVVSVSLVLASLFHSYAATLWVQLGDRVSEAAVVAALAESQDLDTSPTVESSEGATRAVSPTAVAGSRRAHVGAVRADGRESGGFWLWLAADSVAVDAARNAVELARKLLSGSRKT